MCESSRCRSPAGTSTDEYHVQQLYSRASRARAADVEGVLEAPLLTSTMREQEAPLLTSITREISRCRVPAGISIHERSMCETCARAADVGRQQASLLTIVVSESGRCKVPAAGQQAPPLTSIVCESRCREAPLRTNNMKESSSSRCRVPAVTSTHEHHVREQHM